MIDLSETGSGSVFIRLTCNRLPMEDGGVGARCCRLLTTRQHLSHFSVFNVDDTVSPRDTGQRRKTDLVQNLYHFFMDDAV